MKLATLLGSTIGKKVVMAVTGIVLFGFVVGHMIGNLQVYLGPRGDQRLRRLPARVPARRRAVDRPRRPAGCGAAAHLGRDRADPGEPRRAAGRLPAAARASSPPTPRARWCWSGPILLLFIVYHLRHFTFGAVTPGVRRTATSTTTCRRPSAACPASAFYILAMLALGLHLYHGVWSMLQTLGAEPPALERPAHALRDRRHRRRDGRQHLDPDRGAGRP